MTSSVAPDNENSLSKRARSAHLNHTTAAEHQVGRVAASCAPPQPIGGKTKRAFDLAVAVLAVLLLLPLFLVVAATVKASDRGPVFYRQRRIGFNGQVFSCLKFRTMVTNADAILCKYLIENSEAALEWGETQKLRNDPRITPIGRILRKLSIDELPQLVNIIKGEMSLVGPRPIVSEEIEKYGDNILEYQQARPGLTGLWQISGRNDISYTQKISLDTLYVRNWNFWNDLRIIKRTVRVVLTAQGCY